MAIRHFMNHRMRDLVVFTEPQRVQCSNQRFG